MKALLALGFTLASANFAMALMVQPTPGPIVGAVAGPWGIVAAGLGYGAYRVYKALR